MLKYITVFLSLFLCFCSNLQNQNKYCIEVDNFDLNIISPSFNRIDKKKLSNVIANNNNFKLSKNSKFLIELNIKKRTNRLIVSQNIETQMQSVSFSVYYILKNKETKEIIDKTKFIINDNLNISDNRFANYSNNNYILDNFFDRVSKKIENRFNFLLDVEKCKKN